MAPGAKFEFEVDIADVLARETPGGVRYGLAAIYNFTNTAEVIPIRNSHPGEVTRGLKLIVQSMGTPTQLHSDEEGGFRAQELYRFMNENTIKSIQTNTHAHTVERFIRTCLDNPYRRLDGLNQEKKEWTNHVDYTIKQYSNTEHSNTEHNTTQIKPSEAVNK